MQIYFHDGLLNVFYKTVFCVSVCENADTLKLVDCEINLMYKDKQALMKVWNDQEKKK